MLSHATADPERSLQHRHICQLKQHDQNEPITAILRHLGPPEAAAWPPAAAERPLPAGSQQQQSSLAATYSKLSSQLEAQLGGRLTGERDDYLMRLLRRGQQGRPGAQQSGTAQPSSQQPAFTLQLASEAPSAFTHTARQLPQQQQPPPALPVASAGAGQQGENGSPYAKHSPEDEGTPSPKEQQLSPPAHATHGHRAGQHQHRGLGPDFAVTSAVLGQAKARKLRAIILRQQVAFTEQLYELHRAAAVQRLLMRNCLPQQARQLRQCRHTVRDAALAQPGPQDQPQRDSSGGSGAGSGSVPAPTRLQKPAAPAMPSQRPGGPSAHPESMPLRNTEEQLAAQEQREQQQEPAEGPASALPAHLQPLAVGFGAGAPAMPADPMAWWYRTHYGAGAPGQQLPASGFPASSLNPCTAAVAAVAAAPALWQQHKVSWPLASAASGGAAGNGAPSARPAKWWQDPQATFGPPGDPEVVVRGQAMPRGQEVESAPPRIHGSGGGKPDARGPGRKRKGMEAADEASSETTGRDAADGDVLQCGIGAVASAGGSGKDIAFFQKLPVRPKATRLLPPSATKDGSLARGRAGAATPEVEGHRVEEHAAQMLLSFSSRQV
ncbi:hypothetical protein N2152v2_006339 [Parachlorella kessleri]